jgi:predicted 3-demethylubiquinone-9 3-methyltransferase (glyoxalase superfamily)
VTKLTSSKIKPCLWFDTQAEEAANFYTAVFDDSSITSVTRRGVTAPGEAGTVLTVEFEIDGQPMLALNGGPEFTFTEAISFQVYCETQEEVDRLWSTLSDGGEEGPCGWLRDRFGLSWQIVPTVLPRLLSDPDQGRADRAMAAMLGMGRLDIQALTDAADAGGPASGVASRPNSVGA